MFLSKYLWFSTEFSYLALVLSISVQFIMVEKLVRKGKSHRPMPLLYDLFCYIHNGTSFHLFVLQILK